MSRRKSPVRGIAMLILCLLSAGSAWPNEHRAIFRGHGLFADGFGGYDLRIERCGTASGVEAEGPYLLWVLAATGAENAEITGPWGTARMTKAANGTFEYASAWYEPGALPGYVTAAFDGGSRVAPLVLKQGCRPFTTQGAWCSPTFWKNASSAAWAATGISRTDPFNTTVAGRWFGAGFTVDPMLQAVVSNAAAYGAPAVAGTSGYQLDAFNATAAMLTDAIPGFTFDFTLMQAGRSDACPIDHMGNFKAAPP